MGISFVTPRRIVATALALSIPVACGFPEYTGFDAQTSAAGSAGAGGSGMSATGGTQAGTAGAGTAGGGPYAARDSAAAGHGGGLVAGLSGSYSGA